MKTLNYYLFVALSLFVFFSCGKDGDINTVAIEPEVEQEQEEQGLSSKDLTIYSSPCFAGGETLIVHHPENNGLDYFNSESFEVEWFADGKLLQKGTMLDCACGKLSVEVTDLETNTSASMAIEAGGCIDNNQKL